MRCTECDEVVSMEQITEHAFTHPAGHDTCFREVNIF